LAVRILALGDQRLSRQLTEFAEKQRRRILEEKV